jgi:predicted RNA-binding Zn-ribbon protein involved in translation (DUF1610 family)
MTPDADAAFRCPKCGATSALLLPEPLLRESHVALKCLQCAHVVRMSRSRLESATARIDSNTSLE